MNKNSFVLRKISKNGEFQRWFDLIIQTTCYYIVNTIPQISSEVFGRTFEFWKKMLKQTNDTKLNPFIGEKIKFGAQKVKSTYIYGDIYFFFQRSDEIRLPLF